MAVVSGVFYLLLKHFRRVELKKFETSKITVTLVETIYNNVQVICDAKRTYRYLVIQHLYNDETREAYANTTAEYALICSTQNFQRLFQTNSQNIKATFLLWTKGKRGKTQRK